MLDLTQGIGNLRTKLPANPFATAQAVTVLAAVRTFIATYQFRCFFCHRAHFLRAIAAHIQDRPDMQSAYGCVRIPGAAGAIFGKDVGQCTGVFREML